MVTRRPSDTPRWGDRARVHPAFPAGPAGLVVAAPAKLNLFLEIRGKRPDGYHELETLMVAVDLFDTLEVRLAAGGRLDLTCDPPGLPTGPDNLVYKAADRLRGRANRPDLGAELRLVKRIPAQAGLAGGSSDAAAALLALNVVWGLDLSPAELAVVASEVGSDVAFFLALPAAWCTGRGEVVTPEPAGRAFDFVLVVPPVGLGTADVYRALSQGPNPPAPFPTREGGDRDVSPPSLAGKGAGGLGSQAARTAFRAGDAAALGAALFNRLQPPAFGLAPAVETVYRRLAGLNPAGCLMSGSGSAVFAVCRSPGEAARVAAAFRAATPPGEPASRVLVVRSLHIDPA